MGAMRTSSVQFGMRGYADRIQKRLHEASATQGVSKELEEQEIALLERLQKTYAAEKNMVQKLYDTNAQSPVRAP